MLRSRRLVLFLLTTLVVAAGFSAGPRTVRDRWYAVELQGQHAGWMRERVMEEGDERITETVTQFKIRRGQATISIDLEGSIREDAEGHPISMFIRNQMGHEPIETRITFEDDGRQIETKQGGSSTRTSKDPIDPACLTPSRAEKYLREQLSAKATTIQYLILAPASGIEPITITRELLDTDIMIEVDGTDILTTKWNVRQSDAPGVESTEYLDAEGQTIRTETAMGGFLLTTQLTTRHRATRTSRPPELLVNTFVKPNRKIPRARKTSRIVLVLSVSKGKLPALPTTGAQVAEPVDDAGKVRLTINRDENQPALESEAEDERYLTATSYLNHQDPAIVDLMKKATAGAGSTKSERAEAMRHFVSRYINQKDLSTGFASASEVAKNRAGDCTEHGVLLAAMLRVDGIPARVATGLIYVDQFAGARGIFGYHMWAQALIDGEWIDYDATLRNQRFDAAHITVATSPLEEGSLSTDMAALIPLMGRLSIEVVEIEHGG